MNAIPAMITANMKRRLVDRGFSEEDIAQMTPEAAWGHLFTAAALALAPSNQPPALRR